MSETMWVVDEYQDRIVARPSKTVLREAESQFYASKVKNRFDCELEAQKFVIRRAAGYLQKAIADMQKAKTKLRNLTKRYQEAARAEVVDGETR